MDVFQTCQSTYDAVPLYLQQQLYLKPIARLNISLQLPSRITGKNISNWEIMEQLRALIKPEEFSMLKVIKNNVEVVRFVAELEEKSQLEKVIIKVNKKMIKLKQFPEMLRLKAAEAKLDFPTRHTWDSFFREAKDMNEMKPGERPDTVHLSGLPIKWFVPHHLVDDGDLKPSEKIFYRVFEKFGTIRHVDIPICDPYRKKMKVEVSGMQMFLSEDDHYFEGYVQFRDYVGFSKAMDALRGMKLLRKESGINYTVSINVDFDKTKHLSDASIRRREIVRDRLVKQEIRREEKDHEKKKEEQSRINVER